MKTYIDAELQVLRINNNIVTTSSMGKNDNETDEWGNAAGRGRFEDWDGGY